MTKKKIIATVAIATGSVAISLGAFFGISGGVSNKKINDFIIKTDYSRLLPSDAARQHSYTVKRVDDFKGKTRVYNLMDVAFDANLIDGYVHEYCFYITIDESASWMFFNEKHVVDVKYRMIQR